jgi:hypothetical protein
MFGQREELSDPVGIKDQGTN